ncbi:MAG: phytase [Gammaproteobacteria bacterium]|nr:phytase [Gammaproteobacteria bacterium]
MSGSNVGDGLVPSRRALRARFENARAFSWQPADASRKGRPYDVLVDAARFDPWPRTLRACCCVALLSGLGGCNGQDDLPWVPPRVETEAVPSRGDAADDPAIWIHPEAPARSLLVATDKRSGLVVYDLAGKQVQYLPVGNLNNVDLRTGAWGRDDLTVAVASAREPNEITILELDHDTGRLRVVGRGEPVVDEPYGICMYLDDRHRPWVVLNGKDGLFVQFELREDYSLAEARRWRTDTQPEGCVGDDESGTLYIGEEGYGVWRLDADPRHPAQLVSFAAIDDGVLTADVEGLALYRTEGAHYLVVSSQGDNSYAVYDTESAIHLGSFRVGDHPEIDQTSDTDGIAVTSTPLPGFPDGLLVVQDGVNPGGNQNFKLVSWTDVRPILGGADLGPSEGRFSN